MTVAKVDSYLCYSIQLIFPSKTKMPKTSPFFFIFHLSSQKFKNGIWIKKKPSHTETIIIQILFLFFCRTESNDCKEHSSIDSYTSDEIWREYSPFFSALTRLYPCFVDASLTFKVKSRLCCCLSLLELSGWIWLVHNSIFPFFLLMLVDDILLQ